MFSPSHLDPAYDRESGSGTFVHTSALRSTPPPPPPASLRPDSEIRSGPAYDHGRDTRSELPALPLTPPPPPASQRPDSDIQRDSNPAHDRDRDARKEVPAQISSHPSTPPPPPPASYRPDNDRQEGSHHHTGSLGAWAGAATSAAQHLSFHNIPGYDYMQQHLHWNDKQYPPPTSPPFSPLNDAPPATTGPDNTRGGRPGFTHSESSRSSGSSGKQSVDENTKNATDYVPDLEGGRQVKQETKTRIGSAKRHQRSCSQVVAQFLGCLGGPSEHDEDNCESPEKSEDAIIKGTVKDRIYQTLKHAKKELATYRRKADLLNKLLIGAIGLQVFLSALITALSAVTTGRNTSIMTSVLGGAGTVVASYLAHAKGTGDLDLYKKRVTDLEKFERECEAFIKDYGDVQLSVGAKKGGDDRSKDKAKDGNNDSDGNGGDPSSEDDVQMLNDRISELRSHFEMLLGNFDNRRKVQTPNDQFSTMPYNNSVRKASMFAPDPHGQFARRN